MVGRAREHRGHGLLKERKDELTKFSLRESNPERPLFNLFADPKDGLFGVLVFFDHRSRGVAPNNATDGSDEFNGHDLVSFRLVKKFFSFDVSVHPDKFNAFVVAFGQRRDNLF